MTNTFDRDGESGSRLILSKDQEGQKSTASIKVTKTVSETGKIKLKAEVVESETEKQH